MLGDSNPDESAERVTQMPNPGRPSLYELLRVTPDASKPDLARAYRRRARELHPDTAAGSADDDAFAELAQAYRLLADPAQRAAYDATVNSPRPDEPTTMPNAIPVPIRRVETPPHRSGYRPWPPIVAEPTHVHPPEATR